MIQTRLRNSLQNAKRQQILRDTMTVILNQETYNLLKKERGIPVDMPLDKVTGMLKMHDVFYAIERGILIKEKGLIL